MMCNSNQDVREQGLAEALKIGLSGGLAEVFAKGFVKGFEESLAEVLLPFIKNLMADTGWTLERAMETLGISEADRPKYAGLFQKQ